MKKNLWVTVSENEITGNLGIIINGSMVYLNPDVHRSLSKILKEALPPKMALSFIPPNHDNAIRVVSDFNTNTVRQFASDVLQVKPEQITFRYQSTTQSLITVTDEDGIYDYSIDHMKII